MQLVAACEYLHTSPGITHLDVKSANVVLDARGGDHLWLINLASPPLSRRRRARWPTGCGGEHTCTTVWGSGLLPLLIWQTPCSRDARLHEAAGFLLHACVTLPVRWLRGSCLRAHMQGLAGLCPRLQCTAGEGWYVGRSARVLTILQVGPGSAAVLAEGRGQPAWLQAMLPCSHWPPRNS